VTELERQLTAALETLSGQFETAQQQHSEQVEALQRATASAALALTIDVLVLHREPETMTEP